jgi:hypothetical protein
MPKVHANFQACLFYWKILTFTHHFLLILDHTMSSTMIQQPHIPSYGMMQAYDFVIRATEVRGMVSFFSCL